MKRDFACGNQKIRVRLFTYDGNNAKLTENILSTNGQVIASQRYNGIFENNYYFYNQDIRGSVMSIVSSTFVPVKYYTYNEYGKIGVSGYSSIINSETYTGAV